MVDWKSYTLQTSNLITDRIAARHGLEEAGLGNRAEWNGGKDVGDDYCTFIARMLKRTREELQLRIIDVKDGTGIDTKTIINAERGGNSRSSTIADLFDFYASRGATLVFNSASRANNVVDELPVDDRLPNGMVSVSKRLEIYEGCSYLCYYISPDGPLEVITIEPLLPGENNCLYAAASARGNKYNCEVTCAMAEKYTFFSFNCDSEVFSDRVLMMLPYRERIKEGERFSAGIGALLSLAYPSGSDQLRYPCFQKAAIVNAELMKKFNNEAKLVNEILPYLWLDNPLDDPLEGVRSCVVELAGESDDFYRSLRRRLSL